MKANEAPEKIYLNWVNYPLEEMQVEYTRTDAFIEKAEKYIRNVADGLDRDNDVEAFISGFKNYLKRE